MATTEPDDMHPDAQNRHKFYIGHDQQQHAQSTEPDLTKMNTQSSCATTAADNTTSLCYES